MANLAGCRQDLSAQQTKFAIPNHAQFRILIDRRAFENSASGCQRLSKDGRFVRYLVRHWNHITDWQLQKFSVRSIASDNSQHRSLRTVTRIARATKIAVATTGVDLADDASAGSQVGRLGV